MRHAYLALLLLASVPAFAANYATCILDRMPGVANDVAAHSVGKLCQAEFPGGLEAVQLGSGRRVFGYSSSDECTAKKAGSIRSHRGAILIAAACHRLCHKARYYTDEELGILPELR